MSFTLDIKTAEQVSADALAAKRAGASLTKREFCLALAAGGILSDQGCEDAAMGAWPSELAGFLDLLDPAQKRDAKIEWAASGQIDRMDTNILVMASWLGLTDTDIDALFGVI